MRPGLSHKSMQALSKTSFHRAHLLLTISHHVLLLNNHVSGLFQTLESLLLASLIIPVLCLGSLCCSEGSPGSVCQARRGVHGSPSRDDSFPGGVHGRLV